jgi:hypothetical protein
LTGKCLKRFATFIFKAIRNSVCTSHRVDRRHFNDRHVSHVLDEDNRAIGTDIFECATFLRGFTPSTKTSLSGLSNHVSYEVNPHCNYSLVDAPENEDFYNIMDEFEKRVEGDTTLSDSTRALCLTFMSMASEGSTSTEIAEVNGVSSAYITTIRKRLKERFYRFRSAMDAGQPMGAL